MELKFKYKEYSSDLCCTIFSWLIYNTIFKNRSNTHLKNVISFSYQDNSSGTPPGYSPVKQAVQCPVNLLVDFNSLFTAFLSPPTLKYSNVSAPEKR